MKLAIIQLSDIHIVTERDKNPILSRLEKLSGAIREGTFGVSNGIIAITGDVAYSGKKEEYEFAEQMINQIREALKNDFDQQTIPVVIIPGNHDCDFNLDNEIRKLIIENMETANISYINECLKIQSNFYDFSRKYLSFNTRESFSALYSTVKLEIGSRKIAFRLMNSAWVSQIHEQPGKMEYPVEAISNLAKEEEEYELVVSMIHHPLNWYKPEKGKALKKILQNSSDFLMTGHEHVADNFNLKGKKRENIEFLEAGVLQDNTNWGNSSFNICILDFTDQNISISNYDWNGEAYSLKGNLSERPFERNKSRYQRSLEFTDEFIAELDDAGAAYIHPNKDEVLLSDLFVYPDFKEQSKGSEKGALVKGEMILEKIQSQNKLIIYGEERIGKSALARRICRDLNDQGTYPLLLKSQYFEKSISDHKLDKIVKNSIADQYGNISINSYLQLPKQKLAVVFDDFHKISAPFSIKTLIALKLTERFFNVILISGEELRFEELSNKEEISTSYKNFNIYKMMPFGNVQRNLLVTNWMKLGIDESDLDDDVYRQIVRKDKLISNLLNYEYIPSLPVFILILLQKVAIESENVSSSTSGAFGYLYESLITESLLKQQVIGIDLDTMYNYLSEFAYHIYRSNSTINDEKCFKEMHEKYCNDYDLSLDFVVLKSHFLDCGMILERQDQISFRYKYIYYYFVARYFRDHFDQVDIQKSITQIGESLFNEESSNIMMFLCHLTKNERILQVLLDSAKSLFQDRKQFDLNESKKILEKYTKKKIHLTLNLHFPR